MDFPQRKNIRLKNYDYSQAGYYFITLVVKDRKNYFWEKSIGEPSVYQRSPQPQVVGEPSGLPEETLALSEIGRIVDTAINTIQKQYESIHIDKYIIMPNHIHMIMIIEDMDIHLKDTGRPMTAPTIAKVINQMKGYVSKKAGFSMWQRSYYDHVIRTKEKYQEIGKYIEENPLKWKLDKYYIE